MNEADNKQRARGVDSLLNAETVKYFSMEAWEVDKYRESVLDYQGTGTYLSICMEAWEVEKYRESVVYQGIYLSICMEAWEVDKYRESVLDYHGI